MNEEQQNTLLRICSIFQYVVGSFLALISCFPLLYFMIGVFMVVAGFAAPNAPGQSEPGVGQMAPFFVVGGVFMTIGGLIALTGLTVAIMIIITGRRLRKRKSYGFCLTMGAIECLFMPLGTILGVLTVILLANHDVKESFLIKDEPNSPKEV